MPSLSIFYVSFIFTEREICFVASLSRDVTEEAFSLIKSTISYTIHQYSCNSTNYCIILCEDSGEHGASTDVGFEEDSSSETVMIERVNHLRKSNFASSQLYNDLCAACDAFNSPYVRFESEKVGRRVTLISKKIQCPLSYLNY